jgi:hypothetical protein
LGSSNNVLFDNTLDNGPSFQELIGGAFIDGRMHTALMVDAISIQNGVGGGALDIRRVTIPTFANCPGQAVTVGLGDLDTNLLATLNVDNAASVTVDDRLDVGNDGYVVDAFNSSGVSGTFRKTTAGAKPISLAAVGAATLQASDGNNVIQVTQAGDGVQIFSNGGNDQINVLDTATFFAVQTIDINTGSEQPGVAPFGDLVSVDSDAAGEAAKVRLAANDVIRRLTVNANGTFIVPTGFTAQLGELIIPGGSIDLAGGALLSKPGGPTQDTLKTLVARGYAAGAWNGTNASGAINSSLAAGGSPDDAVGYGLGSEIAINSIGGFNIAAADVLVRYTRCGDTDLNGVVDFDDYSRTDNGFNNHRSGWVNGDFDFNNVVDFDDYSLIDLSFNRQGNRLSSMTGDFHGRLSKDLSP